MSKKCKQTTVIAMLILGVLWLTAGCGAAQIDVTLLQNEHWTAEMELSTPLEMLSLVGGSQALDGELEQAVAELNARGATASWKRKQSDTDVVYTITVEGQGLGLLNETMFDGGAQIYVDARGGQRQIHFSYDPGYYDFASLTVGLRGGRVISGNGVVKGDTITWYNPSERMEAVLTEKSGLGLSPILMGSIMGGLLLIGLVILLLTRRRQAAPRYAAPGSCPNCGRWVTTPGRYCPYCGHPRQ